MFSSRKYVCGLLFLVGTLEVAGVSLLRHYDAFYRTVPVEDFNALEYHFHYQTPPQIKSFIGESPVQIMQKIMNFVDQKKPGRQKSDYVQDIYDHAKTGGGLTCAGMSELFLHALRLQGYKARKLFVVKSIGDPAATHTLVEVFQDGKWIIYDPTFNVSFQRNGHLLGATDIAKSLLDGSFKNIKPIFYGEVAYKARLETYPIYWLAHFNNVLLFKHADYSSSWFIRNSAQLVFRYWDGPVLYYFAPTGTPNDYLELLNWFYFFFTCVGPLLFLGLSSICFIIFLFRQVKNRHR